MPIGMPIRASIAGDSDPRESPHGSGKVPIDAREASPASGTQCWTPKSRILENPLYSRHLREPFAGKRESRDARVRQDTSLMPCRARKPTPSVCCGPGVSPSDARAVRGGRLKSLAASMDSRFRGNDGAETAGPAPAEAAGTIRAGETPAFPGCAADAVPENPRLRRVAGRASRPPTPASVRTRRSQDVKRSTSIDDHS